MNFLSLAFFLSLFFGGLHAVLTPEQLNKRVHSHLLIRDNSAACSQAFWGLGQYPESKILWKAYLRALAQSGDEKTMMTCWKSFIAKFPEERENPEVLESLAWGVISKGAIANSPNIRVFAMLGAFFSQDAKGVEILGQGLRDSNSFVRAASVKLSTHLMDATLQDELLRLLENEKVWKTRLEVISAVGEMHLNAAKKELKRIIANDHCHIEEKAIAIEALVSLIKNVKEEQLSQLIASNHAGLRMLACELVAFFDQISDADKLFPLTKDPHPGVRSRALQTLGQLEAVNISGCTIVEIAERASKDPDPVTAITAAWVLTIRDPIKGLPVFQTLLEHPVRDIRLLAAAALAATGKHGLDLIKKAFNEKEDIYIKMNLAIGLIGQRAEMMAACHCLYMGLSQQKERWTWNEDEGFKVLAPSKIKHDEAIPNYPESVNQLTRLEVLQILAVVQYPCAQEAIKSFLKESNWGISGIASALLLTEGDEEAVVLVQELLKDNDQKVRVQAALILALWGKGKDVIQLLQKAYPHADREMKGQILEALGRVGGKDSLGFLAERLDEPYQTLRIIAAAALLESLYH